MKDNDSSTTTTIIIIAIFAIIIFWPKGSKENINTAELGEINVCGTTINLSDYIIEGGCEQYDDPDYLTGRQNSTCYNTEFNNVELEEFIESTCEDYYRQMEEE